MRWIVLLLVACGSSSNPRTVPDDHELHDLSSETSDAKLVRFGGKAVSLTDLPIVADKLGLPVAGTADVMIDVAVPKTRGRLDYAKASGTIAIACTRCQLGDDRARLVLASLAELAPDGIPFGHLTIDHLAVEATITAGKLALTSWKLRSPDFELSLSLSIGLASTFEDSAITGCVRFKPTAALRARDPRMHDMVSLTGAPLAADGMFTIKLEGQYGETKRLAKGC